MPPSGKRPVKSSSDDTTSTQNPIVQLRNVVLALLFNRRYFFHFVSLLLVAELVLGILIIRFIPYTKIDWDAYMQHVQCFLNGERDYSKLHGETGPAVYPALYLYAYTALYKLLPGDPEHRVRAAQYVFLGIYLVTLALVSGIYYSAGRNNILPSTSPMSKLPVPQSLFNSIRSLLSANTYPQALLIPLCLSKRLHSIYILRLFNDPIAMLLLYAGVWAMMRRTERGWRVGVLLYSLALGVKMNILLFLPGLLVLLVQYRGLLKTLEAVLTIIIVQLALPAVFFLRSTSSAQNYFGTAFDFSRQFLYEWTVNWRFVPEDTFLSREFAMYLLAGQVFCLVIFALFKWSPVPGGTKNILLNAISRPSQPTATQAYSLPDHHIPLVLFTSNIIGLTFARSLHYQFHSWYFHQIPFLLYFGGAWGNFLLGITVWLGVEYAWATYPSTNLSSGILSLAHIVIILGLLMTSSGRSGAMSGEVGIAPGEASRKSGTADVDGRKVR